MLNKEKYEREIYMLCVGVYYMDDFKKKTTYKGDCYVKEFGMWANEECTEPFKITQAEKCILENVSYKAIGKTVDGFLYLSEKIGEQYGKTDEADFTMYQHLFEFIHFENSPLKISDILENCEVVENE